MQISAILNHIDSGFIALPRFQRGYVWNRDQVRGLFDSLYRGHPVGGLLMWSTESNSAAHRGAQQLPAGVVKLLLDGQQRITTLYGVVRGEAPTFFEGNAQTFSGLWFNLEDETFEFYQRLKMQDDPLWIDVTDVMKKGYDSIGEIAARLGQSDKLNQYISRLGRLLGIMAIELHEDEVTGDDKSLDVVVDIFNRVNSGGTKLSKGDLALAKICADWPEARETMNQHLTEWAKNGYDFNLDWLLRSVNTVLTGEAKFSFLHQKSSDEVQDALKRSTKAIESCLNMISLRLGLDHDRVLFGRFAVPVMVRYLDQRGSALSDEERDKLLFWFVQSGMWGRFSGSTETYIDQDLAVLENATSPIEELLEQLRLWHGGLRTEPGHFAGSSLGARFYPILYMMTRMGNAKDWCSGLSLKAGMLGKMSQLEVHHIFPKSRLYEKNYSRSEVNALANFCFLTKECNLKIGNDLPQDYFPLVESEHPGALASQWIPDNPELWKIENYRAFLEERRKLLAAETNRRMEDLLHGDTRWIGGTPMPAQVPDAANVPGGIDSEDEEAQLETINNWVETLTLPRGEVSLDYTDPETGAQLAVFDLAWPEGIQIGLSHPVAVLLNEDDETLRIAAKAGYKCFTREQDFRQYVSSEIMPAGVGD